MLRLAGLSIGSLGLALVAGAALAAYTAAHAPDLRVTAAPASFTSLCPVRSTSPAIDAVASRQRCVGLGKLLG
jgi:hypothetical protein